MIINHFTGALYFLTFVMLACSKNNGSVAPTPPTPTPVDKGILYEWNFDGADALHHLFIEDASVQKNGITVVADPLNPSNKVCKATLLKGNDRSEASVYTADLQRILYFYADAPAGFTDKAKTITDPNSLGNEVWLSLRILKPQEQNTNAFKPSIVQFGPVSNATLTPPVASNGFCQLRIRNGSTVDGDSWNWRVFGGGAYTPSGLDAEQNFIKPGDGKWEKFVLHCRYSTGSDGLLEVWKDGVKYINTTGANAISFNRFRIKWGLYLGIGNSAGQDLTCFFDDVKIGGSGSSYAAIQ